MYKNYIRLAADSKTILKTYSTAFQSPVEGDVLVGESENRHFQFDLMDDKGEWQYKYEGGKVVLKSTEEIYTPEKNAQIEKQKNIIKLSKTDSKMVRVIDDLITILVEKEIISLSDLGETVTAKINERKDLRAELNG